MQCFDLFLLQLLRDFLYFLPLHTHTDVHTQRTHNLTYALHYSCSFYISLSPGQLCEWRVLGIVVVFVVVITQKKSFNYKIIDS